jgi:hypothetical protein
MSGTGGSGDDHQHKRQRTPVFAPVSDDIAALSSVPATEATVPVVAATERRTRSGRTVRAPERFTYNSLDEVKTGTGNPDDDRLAEERDEDLVCEGSSADEGSEPDSDDSLVDFVVDEDDDDDDGAAPADANAAPGATATLEEEETLLDDDASMTDEGSSEFSDDDDEDEEDEEDDDSDDSDYDEAKPEVTLEAFAEAITKAFSQPPQPADTDAEADAAIDVDDDDGPDSN